MCYRFFDRCGRFDSNKKKIQELQENLYFYNKASSLNL